MSQIICSFENPSQCLDFVTEKRGKKKKKKKEKSVLANDNLAGFSPTLDVLWAGEQRTKPRLAGSKGLD